MIKRKIKGSGHMKATNFIKHGFYQTTLFTRFYTQHALRPYIDLEMNHIRHVIKIPFINMGIDFIDLPSIFRDNTVE